MSVGGGRLVKPKNFFGRRRGKKLSQKQANLIEAQLPAMSLDIARPLAMSRELEGKFTTPIDEVWLEIGSGGGEHLCWQCEAHPGIGIIGAEPFLNGVGSTLVGVEEKGLGDRVRIHNDDVTSLLDWLPSAGIARAFMLFPDPWPKHRHRYRRLLSERRLDQLARVLKTGAEFRFASDIADYTATAIELAENHRAFEINRLVIGADRLDLADWPVTRYEAKANRASRVCSFLVMNRV